MSDATCDTTELTAVPIGTTCDPIGAIFGMTGISCDAICAMEIIGQRAESGEIFVVTGVT
jgi:hypothetical protein